MPHSCFGTLHSNNTYSYPLKRYGTIPVPLVVVFVNGQFFKDTGAGFLFGGYRMAPREIHIVIINPTAVPATAPYKIKIEEGLKVTDSHKTQPV